jgi:hypothetical protein
MDILHLCIWRYMLQLRVHSAISYIEIKLYEHTSQQVFLKISPLVLASFLEKYEWLHNWPK